MRLGSNLITFPGGILKEKNGKKRRNEKVYLIPTEGKLFQVFFENQSNVMNHREIVSLVQGYEISDWEAPQVVRLLVYYLR